MANLSDDIQCAGSDHDHYQEAACAHHEDHMMRDSVQLDHVVDSHSDYTSDSNIILYDQYVKDNEVPVVHSDVSSVPNDAFMMIYDDMCEPYDQSVSYPSRNTVVKNSLTAELATYKEHVELYEQRAKFELTEREQKINEQLSRVISDRNFKEETLKRELYSIKLQLTSTINHNKSMVEEVSFLNKDFKQKENKYLEDFLDMKTLKEKVEDKLIKQDQSLQIVHMICRPRPNSNELNRVAIGYKNPLCLIRAKQVQPALYNGHEIINDNHTPAIVHNSEDTLEIAETTRKKMNDKMNDPECVTRKIAPHDYSKENLLATFTPQKQLTPEQIFWSNDLMKLKSKALKERTKVMLGMCSKSNKMADVNAPSGQTPAMAPPLRADDQILPHIMAFTASSTIPSIYIQQFWDTILYDKKVGCYRCQLDEQWFVLTEETLREALHITPVNNNQTFAAPPSIDGLIDFINQLGYPKYLKFSAKGMKREVFVMPIPGSLITAEIQQASYYQEYLAKVDQHGRYLAGETGCIQDPPAPKPTQPARKPKTIAPKAPSRPSVSIPVRSAQPAPTSAPAKPQEKKRKQDTETSDKPPKEKKSKHGWVSKKHSRKNVEASKTKEVPTVEPQVVDEDAEYQKVLEESMKYAYALPRGKGKAKVTKEQVAHDLLSLQKHKKTSPADQYIFQRRVSEPTGFSGHDESPYALLGQSDSEEESKKVVLGAKEGGQDEGYDGPDPDAQAEDQTGSDAGAQAKDQTGSDAGVQAEGQAGSNPDETSKGQAGSNPDETSEGQAGSDPGDAEAKQLDEGFTATAYPKVQENLKLAIEETVLLKKPASSSGTLSSLQHLSRDFSFGDQLFSDKPSEADKNAETEVESMVNVRIQQALSLISLRTSPIIDLSSRPESPKAYQQFKATTTDTTTTTTLPPPQAPQQSTTEAMIVKRIGELEHIMADLIQVNKDMDERLDSHGSRLFTLEQLDISQQVSIAVSEVVTDAVDWAMQAPLRNRFRDLPEADMKEILHQRMWESDFYKSHDDHMQLVEALEKSMNRDHSEEFAQDLAEARKKKKKSRESPKTPPGSPSHKPPPPPPLPVGPSGASGAPGSAQVPPSPPPLSSTNQESPSKGSTAPSPSKTAASAEYQAWMMTNIRLRPSISLTPTDLEMDEDMAPDEQAQSSDDEDIRSAHIPTLNLRQGWWKPFEEERPATPEPAWSIRSSDVPVPTNNWASALASNYSPPPEDSLLAHNVSKPLPLGGPPGQVTIQSDFFFNKDLEYLRYGSKGRRPALSISKMKAAYYPDAGLEQLVMRQRVEDFQLGIENYQTQLNLTKPHWDATGYEYKHDYTLIDSPRAAIFRDKYGVQMMMRVNEIHKFSDGTFQQIDKASDYRIKEFRINRMNSGLNTRFWTRMDVDRSKAFMFAIQRCLKTRRIFCSLESFVGGRVREGDYRLLKRTE
nr:hypothetical protein [Tanacetum cinerariifolium]